MDYLDEELLEAKRKLERQKHTTLETGIYAGEELITFKQTDLFDICWDDLSLGSCGILLGQQ